MSDSEDGVGPQGPAPKRERRHRFKTFAERVAEVDVDVFRRVQAVRALPKTGTHSFFQEHLEKWRELNSAADFLAVSASVHPLCASLPQLLHHKAAIVDTILAHLHLKAILSAEPLLDLLAALTRDLGSEILPLLPAIFNRLSELVDEGGDREPEMLEALFTSVSLMFKHLSKLLSADLPFSLKLTASLRYSHAEHVRTFASQAVGFLFRNAPQGHLRTGVRALLAEQAVRPVWARTHGAGTLLAEAMQGVGNTTHSRLPLILSLLLQEDLLKPSDFQMKSSTGDGTGFITTQHLQGCAAAVASVAIDQLLEHVRRGKAVDLWGTVMNVVRQRLQAVESAVKSKKQTTGMLELSRSAGRAVGLLAEMVHFHRGSRVEEFDGLLDLLNRLGRKELLSSVGREPAKQGIITQDEVQDPLQADEATGMEVDGVVVDVASGARPPDSLMGQPEDGHEDTLKKFLRPSLSEQALQLLLGVVNAHCKVIGASKGMTTIQRSLPLWTAFFSHSPARHLLPFLRSLTQRPVSQEGIHVLGPHMLGALGGLLVNSTEAESADIKELALPLLVDTCSLMAPQGALSVGKGRTPLLLMANPGGVKLAEYILNLAGSYTDAASLPSDTQALAEGWCAVLCLPYASKDQEVVVHISEQVMEAVVHVCKKERPGMLQDSYLMLYSAAVEVLCKVLPSHSPAKLAAVAASVLAVALQHPSSYALLKATAHLLTLLKRQNKGSTAEGSLLSPFKLLEALKVLELNLSTASQSMRAASLSLLCAFNQPELNPSVEEHGNKTSTQSTCDVFPVLLSITSEPCTIEHGRTWAVAISRFATQLEYDRIPADFTVPLVKGILGVLYMRFSPLWEPCAQALGAALQYRTEVTWPVVLHELEKVQGSFLAGTGQGISAPPPTWSLEAGLSESEEVPDGLKDRFHQALLAGTPEALRGCTDASTRLTYLLKAMAKAPSSSMEAKGKDWVPLLLTYTKAKSIGGIVDVEEDDNKEEQADDAGTDGFARVGMKAWRMGLREWLTFLADIRGARGLPNTLKVQQSVAGLLLDTDQALQQAVLKCLRAFKYKYLSQHVERLLRLSDNATLREELVSFPLSRGADGGVSEEHRAGLLPLLIRVLFPKMRKRSGRLAGKGASGSARAAILNSLAALEPLELQPLLELFLAPLAPVFKTEEDDSKALQATENDMDTHQLLPPAWWAQKLSQQDGHWWLKCVDITALDAQPLRRKLGFLNAFEDLLNHLGYRLQPYLPALLALTLHLLSSVCSEAALQPSSAANNKHEQEGVNTGNAEEVAAAEVAVVERPRQEVETVQKGKEIRSQCLRLLAQVLDRFPTTIDYNFMWDTFFSSVQPLLGRLAAESASDREPPLLACTFSLASSPALVSVLANMPSGAPEDSSHMLLDSVPMPTWVTNKSGSALLLAAVDMLQAPNCSEASRSSILALLQSILDMEESIVRSVLVPWSGRLMSALRAVVVAIWEGRDRRALGKKGKKRSNVLRELAILERLGSFTQEVGEALELADALVSLLQHKPNRRGKAFADETGGVRALGALTAVWNELAGLEGEKEDEVIDETDRLLGHWDTLSSLPIRLVTREARTAMCSAVAALARLLPFLQHTSGLLSALNSWLPDRVEEMDYDRRLKAYSDLIPLFWSNLTERQCSPLLLTCLYDMRNADDLALRQAASQAVIRFVEGMKKLQAAMLANPTTTDVDMYEEMMRLIPRVLFPHLKSQLSSSQLAVRQEHLIVLRTMVVELPNQFPELLQLSSTDQETDFFLNVAHLQVHRRVRAMGRLRKLIVRKSGAGPDDTQEAADAVVEDEVDGQPAHPQHHPLDATHTSMLLRLLDVVLPLLKLAILDAGGDKSVRAQDKRAGDASREANVVDAAVSTLGVLTHHLPWPQYRQILLEFLNLLKGTPSKPVLRALCTIIDHFHFDLSETADEPVGAAQVPVPLSLQEDKKPDKQQETRQDDEQDGQQLDVEEEEEEEDDDNLGATAGTAATAGTDVSTVVVQPEEVLASEGPPPKRQISTKEIRNTVMKRVLPTLHGQLVQNDVVRAPVALALVKLLRLLPDSIRRVELPRTLQAVSNLLKSRAQSVRDDARSVIVGMSVELGSDYVPYVCQVLRASLPDRGYTAHVMGYTLHAVVEAVVKSDRDGTLDDSVELALPIVDAELFGETGLAKEAEMFAVQYKESKRSRANETYQLLAQGITLDTHLTVLLSLVRAHLPEAASPKVRNKLTLLLQHAARGVLLNPTATPEPLMVFVHDCLAECLEEEERQQALAKAAQGAAVSAAAERTAAAAKGKAAGSTITLRSVPHEHEHGAENGEGDEGEGGGAEEEENMYTTGTPYDYLMVEFALQLLQQAMKKGQLASQDNTALSLLDPMLALLVRAVKSRHSGSVSLALRCLSFMVHLNLPSLQVQAVNIGKAVTTLLKKVPSIHHPIAQECFKLLAGMLRDCSVFHPSTAQLRFLLSWTFTDLEDTWDRGTAFSLLRAILNRKIVVPEVYDVMNRVQEVMVKSHSAPIRQLCSSSLLQFLLDFPLGPKRLQKHMQFLLSNLEFEYEDGRLQVVDLLQQIVVKFPEHVIESYAELLFLPLVVRLVSDPAPKARTAVAAALRTLLGRVSQERRQTLGGCCVSWLAEDGTQMRRAAAQTLGLLAEVEGSKFSKRVPDVVHPVVSILSWQSNTNCGGLAETDGEAELVRCPRWQEAYYCLLMLEKVATKTISSLSGPQDPSLPNLWRLVSILLSHNHLWVRKAAARLVGTALAHPQTKSILLQESNAAGLLAWRLYQQMDSDAADEATCKQAVKCLVGLADQLMKVPVEKARKTKLNKDSRDAITAGHVVGQGDDANGGEDGVTNHEEKNDGEDNAAPLPPATPPLESNPPASTITVNQAALAKADKQAAVQGGDAAHEGQDDEDDNNGDGEDEDDNHVPGDGTRGRLQSSAADSSEPSLSMWGLARRMATLVEDNRYNRMVQRRAAIGWIAAIATSLGPTSLKPLMVLLMKPLYRTIEGDSRVPEDIKQLGQEVVGHLRDVMGADELLAAYNAARKQVQESRAERKKRAGVQALVDPEAVAKARRKKTEQKQVRNKRIVEDQKRVKSAHNFKAPGVKKKGMKKQR